MNRRHAVLFAALAATLLAVWGTAQRQQEEDDVVLAEATPGRAHRPAATTGHPPPGSAAATPGGHFGADGPDLFPRHSWQPPPPPPPKPVALPPPPPPQPPTLPFAYLGKWQEDGREQIFLSVGDRVEAIRAGTVLNQWRVDEIAPGRVVFTYLPMDKQQTLRIAP